MEISLATQNLWDKNKHPWKAIERLMKLHADVICLQEVPARVLPRLEELPGYDAFVARDCLTKDGRCIYLVILVHKKTACIKHHVVEHRHPPQRAVADFFTHCDRSFLESHSVHIQNESGESCSIVNCHLSATGSMHKRRDALREVVHKHDYNIPRVIAGDFNTMGSPLFVRSNDLGTKAGTFLVNLAIILAFGARLTELFTNELALLKKLAHDENLAQLFKRIITHRITGRHLDHVLISSNDFVLLNRHIIDARGASDHHGLLVNLELQKPPPLGSRGGFS